MKTLLQEYIQPSTVGAVLESIDEKGNKTLYMSGVCIQGDVKNHNQRIYPVNEIQNAVNTLQEQISISGGVLGEVDHPDSLTINLDRVSHMIVDIHMQGPNGIGKMKILPTPMGQLVRTMVENGVRLGVSSRGSGNVDEYSGKVSDFEIITVDVVATPSAPNAYPTPVYESLLNRNFGHKLIEMAGDSINDNSVQHFLQKEVLKVINELKLKR